ncbi:MAG TPA: LysR substrate-binding domain-containing protein [Anaeromyxobacteraceae bacterium]|nr:LysR substrate-binding domain-containing protein [Anaeromyxobacteraceae bacterium]
MPSEPTAAATPAAAPAREIEAAPAALRLEQAGRSFGAFQALEGISLTVRAGERVAIIGPSGAGKSTFLRLANASLFATSGSAAVLGEEPARLGSGPLRRLRARIGTVYQQLLLVPQASVLENVLMGRLGRRPALQVALGALRRSERAAVAALLDRVGIAGKLDERLDRLSGGEQQRVALARVFWQAPELVLADEPFSAVDPEWSAAVVRLLVEASAGRTLLLSTHQLEPVFPHFPRVVGLRAGRVLFDKPREAVTPGDLARLYQPEGATRATEPRRVLPPVEPAGPAVEVRVGASTTPGEVILPGLLPAFTRRHPGVPVRLGVKDTAEVLGDLVEGRVDLAFVGARNAHPALHFEDFAEDEIVLVAAPGFALPPGPLGPSAAGRLPRVEREPGSATRAIVEAQLAALGAPLDPAAAVLEAGSVAAQRRAVTAGLGVGFASRRSVAPELASGALRVVPIESFVVPRRFFVAWRRDEPLPALARAFLAAARAAESGG